MPDHNLDHNLAMSVVAAYVGAFADGDPAAIVDLFASEATLEDPVGAPLKQGTAEIATHYRAAIATVSELRIEGSIRASSHHAAFSFVVMTKDGRKIEVIDIFRLDDDGKIVQLVAYWGPANVSQA